MNMSKETKLFLRFIGAVLALVGIGIAIIIVHYA
jgi:hypothetical protein